jgi:hypothetical protein
LTDWLKANALTLVTATVAIYGAVLSTLNYRHSRAEKKRRLDVRLSGGFLTYGPGMGTHLSDYKCIVTISNPGHTSVTLRSVRVAAGKFNIIVSAEDGEPQRLPHEILPGQDCTFWVDVRGIAESLAAKRVSGSIRLRGIATDGTGTEFSSQPVAFDVDGFSK